MMHKTARDYALKHKAPLGRFGTGHGARTGYYYLNGAISITPTAQGAITLMRKAGYK